MITSCSPGWVKYCETYNADFIPNLSSCKSAAEMLGAVIKTCYAEKVGIAPGDIKVVSVMPCTAKKFEATRPRAERRRPAGRRRSLLTTRELAAMIRMAGVDSANLPDEEFDSVLGESTGAGVIFGVTGGEGWKRRSASLTEVLTRRNAGERGIQRGSRPAGREGSAA